MLKNYIFISIRNLLRYKRFTLVNIMGLTIGIASCILMLLYILHEVSYDRYHKNADKAFRVVSNISARQYAPLGPFLIENLPGIRAMARIKQPWHPAISYKEKTYYKAVHFADPDLFEIFDFAFIAGDPQSALTHPNSMVITREIKELYFGDDDALGKILIWDNEFNYKVTGIVEIPYKSHLHFDILASFATLDGPQFDFYDTSIWPQEGVGGEYTYLLLGPNFPSENFSSFFLNLIEKYKSKQYRINLESSNAIPYLQPIMNIHLHSHLPDELQENSDISYLYLAGILAIFILAIASINYVNLSISQSVRRTKEVGVRKVLGADRATLIRQFLCESVIVFTIVLFLALLIAYLLLPDFSTLIGKTISMETTILFVFSIFILLTLLVGAAGAYPAFIMSMISPIELLKSRSGSKTRGENLILRKTLVVFQFATSSLLIVATLTVYNQLEYIQNKNIGLNKDQILVMRTAYMEVAGKIPSIKKELSKDRDVLSVSSFDVLPSSRYEKLGETKMMSVMKGIDAYPAYISTDGNFADLLSIDMVAGRYISDRQISDADKVVINESAVTELGFQTPEEALGKWLRVGESAMRQIVGVVTNFHYESLHSRIRPLVIGMGNPYWPSYLGIKVRAKNIASTQERIRDIWQEFIPNMPYTFWFLDEDFAHLYRDEQRLSRILGIFTLLSLIIAALGIYAISTFMAERRTKEIGIRKVVGASTLDILLLFLKEFTALILLGNIMTWPLCYYIMGGWLDNFAYRVDIGLSAFVSSGILVVIIGLGALSYQVIKTALMNPVQSLRYE
jgi:putative ABC transport system permease protein